MPAEALPKCAADTEHDQQALRPLHDAMQTILTEFSASPTDDARDLVNAAQVMLTGERQDVRNLCKPWGVHLTAQKKYRPMDIIEQEFRIALTERAMKLKSAI